MELLSKMNVSVRNLDYEKKKKIKKINKNITRTE